EFGGQRFTLRHDTVQSEAVLRVPVPARAVVAAPANWPEPRREDGDLAAWAKRLDQAAEPFELRLERPDEVPSLLLPGRYRIELVLVRWQDGRVERTPQGPAAEVELRAGELARVLLH
ncbi:MAG TPA: hypothetical protein VFZ65_16785, partial [Planctomycetota bacterium]|nr:hypothetical protein [Planctomycetota bacterium]